MTKIINVSGMMCEHCEESIKKSINKLNGVYTVTANFKTGVVIVDYDDSVSLRNIINAIETIGYSVDAKNNLRDGLSLLVIGLSLMFLAEYVGINFSQNLPIAKNEMTYIMLFGIGILTSFHCVAMCGGLNLTSSLHSNKALKTSILYNSGRLLSYSLIGGLLGVLGSIISITIRVRAVIGIIAAIFMIIMGLKMMGCFPIIKHIALPVPLKLKMILSKLSKGNSFFIGLINGFMPCGPLQSMQLLAIASGSFIVGFFSMFAFCLGTIPLMFLFGLVAGIMKNKWKNTVALVGGVLIILFGVSMLSNNLALTGINLTTNSEGYYVAMQERDIQIVKTELLPNAYPSIEVKLRKPVKWVIMADEGNINGCNNEINIPNLNMRVELHEGENIIEFLPNEEGVINYSCWMGMIKAQIRVVK